VSEERCKHDLVLADCGYCSKRPRVLTIRGSEKAEAAAKAKRRHNADFKQTPGVAWGRAFPANFAGNCAICGDRFGSGTSIRGLLDVFERTYAEATCVDDHDE
jgi:hypothetical protein